MPISVVLIDDHAVLLETLVRTLLTEPDIEVMATASSLESGIDAVRRHQPDVIVVDQGLPTVDGAPVATAIREGRPDAAVLVLLPPNASVTPASSRRVHHLAKVHAIEQLARAIRFCARTDANTPGPNERRSHDEHQSDGEVIATTDSVDAAT